MTTDAVFLSSACSLLFVKLQTVGTRTRRQADEHSFVNLRENGS